MKLKKKNLIMLPKLNYNQKIFEKTVVIFTYTHIKTSVETNQCFISDE